jgi:choline dehydrogenase-like flavoprotein
LVKTLGAEVARLNLGRVRLADWLLDGSSALPSDVRGGFHHMGTTRMAADPKDGVVDADCRVHGIENLFVAGSSVFATGGCANPTLTIVALALRLSNHLKARLT